MKNIYTETVKYLTKSEYKRWIKFLDSPYFNNNKKMLLLAKYITKHTDDTDSIDKKHLYKQLYPTDVFNAAKLNTNFSRLFKLLLRFLEVETSSYQHRSLFFGKLNQLSKLIVYNDEYVYAFVDKSIEKTIKSLERDYSLGYDQKKYLNDFYNLKGGARNKRGIGFTPDTINDFLREEEKRLQYSLEAYLLDSLMISLNYFFMKYRYLSFDGTKSVVQKHSIIEAQLPDNLKYHFNSVDEFTKDVNIKLLYYANKIVCLYPSFRKDMVALSELFTDNTERVNLNVGFTIVVILIQQIPSYIYAGIDMYEETKHLLSIIKAAIDKNIINEDYFAIPLVFSHILDLALVHEDLSWYAYFLENKINLIAEPYKNVIYSLYAAKLSFAHKQYDKAQEYLSQLQLEEGHRLYNLFSLTEKEILFKVHYELGNYEICKSLTNSIYIYLYRKKDDNAFKTTEWVFINDLFKKLLQQKYYELQEKLKERTISTYINHVSYKWLQDKVNQFFENENNT